MNQTLNTFKKIITGILIISIIIESIFFFDSDNLLGCLVLFYGWMIINLFVLTTDKLLNYPVSFLMILGLALFYYVLPLPLTLLELKPVTYNLLVPNLTFYHHFLFVTVIVFTHQLYTFFAKGGNVFRKVLSKTDFYHVPSNKLIWISSVIAIASSYYLYFVMGVWQLEKSDRSFIYYTTTILSSFVWMPLILPFPKYRNAVINGKYHSLPIILYSVLVFIMSVASNWRTIMFSGVIMFGCLFVIGVLMNYYSFRKIISPVKAVFLLLIIYAISVPLMDLSYAMIIVRQERTKMNATEFLEKTIEVYNDDYAIEEAKKMAAKVSKNGKLALLAWDEQYLDNAVINRFVNLKISDNCLYYAKQIGFRNHEMQKELERQIEAMFPNVLLDYLGVDLEKKMEVSNYSIGDYLYSLAINDYRVRGSAVISSMSGIGMSIFGYWYLLLLIPMFLIIFTMFDSFVKIEDGKVVYSYLFFVMLVSIVNYFNDRHVYTFEIRFIIRTYWESVIIYLITLKIFRVLDSFRVQLRLKPSENDT